MLAPTGLPPSWRATQAEWVPKGIPYLNDEPSVRNLWQLGFLAPDDIFIAVNQGDALPEQFVADYTREGLPDGTSQIAGQPWERRISPDERTRSLVRTSPAVTTVVVGDTTVRGPRSLRRYPQRRLSRWSSCAASRSSRSTRKSSSSLGSPVRCVGAVLGPPVGRNQGHGEEDDQRGEDQ